MLNYRHMRVRIILISAISLLLFAGRASADDRPALVVFHSPTCHRCLEIKKNILPQIEKEFKNRIRIEYRDVTDVNDFAFMFGLQKKYNKDLELSLPVFFIEGQLLNGKGDVKSALKIAISVALSMAPRDDNAVTADLLSHFRSFTPLAIAGAGLADGINPCAFTVIVFFISYLALQGYRKVELAVIGLSFVLAVFCAYLLIGMGIFNFLYQFEGFWIVTRVFNITVGVLSLALGGLAIYDLLKFRKTRDPEGMILRLPGLIKERIHSVIGMHYRRAKGSGSIPEKVSAGRFVRLILSALITGFLVSILEAVCTGQLYLPTLAFIFKTTPLKAEAFAYLALYNMMFIVPLLVIFLLALVGVTSAQFAGFIRKHMVSIKALMSAVFIGLGVFLIWRG